MLLRADKFVSFTVKLCGGHFPPIELNISSVIMKLMPRDRAPNLEDIHLNFDPENDDITHVGESQLCIVKKREKAIIEIFNIPRGKRTEFIYGLEKGGVQPKINVFRTSKTRLRGYLWIYATIENMDDIVKKGEEILQKEKNEKYEGRSLSNNELSM